MSEADKARSPDEQLPATAQSPAAPHAATPSSLSEAAEPSAQPPPVRDVSVPVTATPAGRALRELACGITADDCELAETLTHIGGTVETLVEQVAWLRAQPDNICTVYGPFLGRSILEVVLTALISRTDPFRVLVLREMQRKAKEDIGVRRKAAIQWTGDVLSKKKAADLWSSELAFEEISRALLGDHLDHVFWRSAFTRMADLPEARGGSWLAKYRLTSPEGLLSRIRSDVTRQYSSLSKGLHHEFVIPPAVLYDRTTVIGLVQDVLDSASTLALASHMVGHVAFRLDPLRALDSYERIQGFQIL